MSFPLQEVTFTVRYILFVKSPLPCIIWNTLEPIDEARAKIRRVQISHSRSDFVRAARHLHHCRVARVLFFRRFNCSASVGRTLRFGRAGIGRGWLLIAGRLTVRGTDLGFVFPHICLQWGTLFCTVFDVLKVQKRPSIVCLYYVFSIWVICLQKREIFAYFCLKIQIFYVIISKIRLGFSHNFWYFLGAKRVPTVYKLKNKVYNWISYNWTYAINPSHRENDG